MSQPNLEDLLPLVPLGSYHPGGLAETRRIGQLTGMTRGMLVLDVSTGRGASPLLWATEFGSITVGLDLRPELVAEAADEARARDCAQSCLFVAGDALSLPLAADAFDVVVNECSAEVTSAPQTVLSEMARVTDPGGEVVLAMTYWRGDDEALRRRTSEAVGGQMLPLAAWEQMLARAGLVVVQREDWSERPDLMDSMGSTGDRLLPWYEYVRIAGRVVRHFGLLGTWHVLVNGLVAWRAFRRKLFGYHIFVCQRSS